MKRFRIFGLLALLGLLFVACSTSSTPTPPTNTTLPISRFDPYPEEFKFLELTNNFRSQARTCGGQQFAAAPALTWVEAVGDTAWFHSADMSEANSGSHVGASTIDRLRTRGFDPGATAENRLKTALPAGGQAPNPSDIFNAWSADATACANIMNPKFTVMGAGMFGYYEGGTAVFWTQVLTTPKGNTPDPTLTVSPTAATAIVGGATIALTATLTNSTDAITWSLNGGRGSLSATTGANISYTPPTTGGAGTATLTATSGALTASATITINAAAPVVNSITISPEQATALVGGNPITFTASTDSGQSIGWALSATSPGSISNANGTQTTYTPPATGAGGTATLCAASGNASKCVNILLTSVTIAVSPNATTVQVGGAAVNFITAISPGSDPNNITWNLTGAGSISNATGGSTTYTPPATGAAGTATLTATLGAATASATITINAAPPPPTLTVNPPTATVKVGDTAITFGATLTNSTNAITWSLNGPGSFSFAGATATYTPPVTGGASTATLTASAGALTATATLTINAAPPVQTLTVTPTTATVKVGDGPITFTSSTNQVSWSMTGPGTFSWGGSTFTYFPPATGPGGTAVVTVSSVPPGLTASATITVNPPPTPPAPDIQQFLTLINQFRSQPQLCFSGDTQQTMPAVPPVTFNAQLNTAARLHSQDMADKNYFSHTGLNGSTFGQRATAAGYTGFANGENIAAGNGTPQGAFDQWKNSHTGHCQGMMSANADEIGLGYGFNANADFQHYWTFMTGKK